MFLGVDTVSEAIGGIARQDRNLPLEEYRARIAARIHEMDGAARFGLAGGEDRP